MFFDYCIIICVILYLEMYLYKLPFLNPILLYCETKRNFYESQESRLLSSQYFTNLISKLPLTILTLSQFTEMLCTISSCPVKLANISTSLKLSPVHQSSIMPLSDAKANRFLSSQVRSVQPAFVEAQQLQCLLSGAYILSGAWSGVLNSHNEPFQ